MLVYIINCSLNPYVIDDPEKLMKAAELYKSTNHLMKQLSFEVVITWNLLVCLELGKKVTKDTATFFIFQQTFEAVCLIYE